MLTVFLDANVLFSAAYKPSSRLLDLWSLPKVTLVTSAYAVAEARRNLPKPSQQDALDALTKDLRILLAPRGVCRLPPSLGIPEKDIPILVAAIQTKADVLLTGDLRHFGPHYGRKIKGVRILAPAAFLDSQKIP